MGRSQQQLYYMQMGAAVPEERVSSNVNLSSSRGIIVRWCRCSRHACMRQAQAQQQLYHSWQGCSRRARCNHANGELTFGLQSVQHVCAVRSCARILLTPRWYAWQSMSDEHTCTCVTMPAPQLECCDRCTQPAGGDITADAAVMRRHVMTITLG